MSADEPEEASPRPAAVGDAAEQQADNEGVASKPSPTRRAKRKRRAAAIDAGRLKAARADADDEEATKAEDRDAPPRADVPAFALSFPRDAALDELVVAFEQGDYARVRREAPALARRTARPEVRRAARELRKRLDPDPIAIYLLVAASLLLAFLAVWYWTHPHEAP
jgi:hypothetical protein